MLYGFTYDGRHSSEFNLTVTSVKRKLHAPVKPRLVTVPQKPGAYNYGKPEIGHLVFEVSVLFTAQDNKSFHDLRRDIIAWLYRDKEVELVFDDEPDKYYMAQYSEESDIDRLGTTGSTTLYFISSDPYAFGETKTQRIANPHVVFQREGIRYREDGTEVTENYPVYKSGKFDQAILVEEGTENLLPSAASPTQEELSLTVGDDYYLSTYGGSATIEHKKSEAINRTLDKEGVNYSYTVDTEWESGMHNGTAEVGDQYLRLAKSGTDFSQTSSRLSVNTPGYKGDYAGQNDCSSLAGWTTSSTGNYNVVNGTIIVVDSSNSSNAYIYRNNTVNNPGTLDFRLKAEGVGRINVQDGTNEFQFNAPNTNGEFKWYRIRVNGTTAMLYENGTLIQTVSPATTGTNKYISFYLAPADIGSYEIDHISWANKDLGAPPANGVWFLSGESIWLDLSSVGLAASSQTTFTASTTTIDGSGLVKVEYQLDDNGTIGDYTEVNSGDAIPGITKGKNLSGVKYRKKFLLQTTDPTASIYIDNWTDTVTSGYNQTGSWESPALDISQVGKAAETSISWVTDSVPAGTSVKVYTRLSLDGGNTWSDWTEVANSGDPIPEISQSTDLSNASFQYRVELSTSDVAVTPSVDSLMVSLASGYKPSQTFTLPPVDVSNIGQVSESVLSWTEDKPASTNITVETSIDGTNWTPVTNGGAPVPSGTDLAGKSLHVRYTLSTSDTSITPTLQSIEWKIAQAEPNRIKPATGTIVLTPSDVDRWQLENKPYSTGWHAYGSTRNDESLQVPVEIDGEGTIELWAHDDGRSLQRDRFIFDAEGVLSLRKAADDNYVVAVNGADVLTIAPPPSGWHYWAVRWNNTAVDVFLDGESVATFPLGNPLDFESVNRILLGCTETGLQWNDLLDDLRVSRVFRSNEEISAIFDGGEPSPEDDYTEYKIAFDGTLSPTVDAEIEVGGTAPTQGIFTITFINNAPYFKISNGTEYVQIDSSFKSGDVLEIDCVREVVRKNGSREDAMPFLYIESDFFDLIPGGPVFVEPAGVAKVDATFTERWR